jgi:hypothetical protein
MDSDRKYKQHGYMDTDRPFNGQGRDDRPKQQGPRLPLDVTGPRLPRMVQTVVAARCYNCATALPSDFDFTGTCPKCNVALHCCKQCAYFDSSTRFQCMKPIPVRIAQKDGANQCGSFSPRVTVARDAKSGSAPVVSAPVAPAAAPRVQSDARAAFDSLFKK